MRVVGGGFIMKRIFIFPESKRVQEILNESYPSILAALKVHKQNAISLIEDETYSQLHDLLALVMTGQIIVKSFCDGDDIDNRFIGLTIKED